MNKLIVQTHEHEHEHTEFLEADTVAQLSAEAEQCIVHLAQVAILAPGAEGHDHGGGVVVARVVQRLVGHRLGRLVRLVAALHGVDHLLVAHHVGDAVGGEHHERIAAMFYLQLNVD